MEHAVAPPPERPTGLYVVGIGMIVVGIVGFCCQLFSGYGAMMGPDQTRAAGMFDEAMIEPIIEAQKSSQVPMMVVSVLGVLTAVAVIVFGALVLARHRAAVVTPVVLAVAATVTLLHAALYIWSQMLVSSAMKSALASMSQAEGVEVGIAAGMGFTICIFGGWALTKIGFFIFSALYLRKPAVRMMFGAAPPLDERPAPPSVGAGGGPFGGPPAGH